MPSIITHAVRGPNFFLGWVVGSAYGLLYGLRCKTLQHGPRRPGAISKFSEVLRCRTLPGLPIS